MVGCVAAARAVSSVSYVVAANLVISGRQGLEGQEEGAKFLFDELRQFLLLLHDVKRLPVHNNNNL